MVNITSKALALALIGLMLIGFAVSTPLAAKGYANVPLTAELAAEDVGLQSAGMRGCNGGAGGGRPGGPPTTAATTSASG